MSKISNLILLMKYLNIFFKNDFLNFTHFLTWFFLVFNICFYFYIVYELVFVDKWNIFYVLIIFKFLFLMFLMRILRIVVQYLLINNEEFYKIN